MKALIPALAAATLAIAATFAFAQGGPGGGYGPGAGMQSQGRGQMREQMRGAYEACKDKPDQRACMAEQYCAKSPDPAQCQARAKERAQYGQQRLEERQKLHEACNGKRGDELTKCMQTQHQARRSQNLDERQKAHEACNGKRGEELAKCLGAQPRPFGPRGPQSRG